MRSIFTIIILTFFYQNNYAQTCNYTVSATPDTIVCAGEKVQLQAIVTGNSPNAASYQWNPATNLNNFLISNPVATVNNSVNYTVNVRGIDNFSLVNNGDFENGATGFTTNYATASGGVLGPITNDGEYLITTSPNLAHNNFPVCADHTPTPGTNMMVINGSTTANTNIWCQTIAVTPNTNYVFVMWGMTTVASNVAVMKVKFNNTIAPVTFTFPITSCVWQEYNSFWNSGTNTSVAICIYNQTIAPGGNDFAIDDLGLFQICDKSATINVQQAAIPTTTIDTFICPDGDILAGGMLQTTAGTYYDTLTTSIGCDSIIVTNVAIQQPSKPNLGADTTLCGTDAYLLSSKIGNVTYQWSDGSFDSTLIVTIANDYSLTVSDAAGCQNSDTVSIAYNPYPILNLGNDTTFCLGDESVLNIQQNTSGADYLWQNGSNNATLVVREPGDTYIASVTLDNCTKIDTVNIDYQPCECTVAVPNAFTPNGDNRNDIFQILYDSNCIFSTFNLQIFNRWGKLVFSNQDINSGWDGYVNGTLQAEDSYLYVVEYELTPQFNQPKQVKKGSFLLIR